MRWVVLSLLVTVTMVNYLDRLLLSVLSPVLRDYFHFNESLYGNITGAFQIAYAFGFLALGKFVDRVGTKIGLGIAAAVWSAASLLHATVTNAVQFGAWRAVLGLAESANFPACNKAISEWFPPAERALATGIFNAGVNAASVIGPPVFIALSTFYGWRACFIAVSSVGFLWLLAWNRLRKRCFVMAAGPSSTPPGATARPGDSSSAKRWWTRPSFSCSTGCHCTSVTRASSR